VSSGSLIKQFGGHTNTVYGLAFSADGQVLYSAGLDGTIRRWPLDRASLIRVACSTLPVKALAPAEQEQYKTSNTPCLESLVATH
jgi:WD40 repeat protein